MSVFELIILFLEHEVRKKTCCRISILETNIDISNTLHSCKNRKSFLFVEHDCAVYLYMYSTLTNFYVYLVTSVYNYVSRFHFFKWFKVVAGLKLSAWHKSTLSESYYTILK